MTGPSLDVFLLARFAEDDARADRVSVVAGDPWSDRRRAECVSKRRILLEATRLGVRGDRIRRSLAEPYSDHPDWREEWRP